jgi:hypothetical protein
MRAKIREASSGRRSYGQKSTTKPPITPAEYGGLQEAYDHFNAGLFGGSLPEVFITYQRQAHSKGFFSAKRFDGRIGELVRDEIALNPDAFIGRSDAEICSTLVHEMVHAWQQARGTAPSRSYHDKEWAARMREVGLMPSSTGAFGGKQTGHRVSHYVIPGGLFEKVFNTLAAIGWKLNLQSAHRPGPTGGTNSKSKFTCGICGQNAWGKPTLEVICGPCLARKLKDADINIPAVLDDARMRAVDAPVAEAA